MTPELCRDMSPAEKWRRLDVAFLQIRAMHRVWFLARYPLATEFEIRCEWGRVTGCAAVIARCERDRAGREADPPIVMDVTARSEV